MNESEIISRHVAREVGQFIFWIGLFLCILGKLIRIFGR